jgi:hypothetical protein
VYYDLFFNELDVVVQSCNPSIQEAEASGAEVEASLGYRVRSCLKEQNSSNLLLKIINT